MFEKDAMKAYWQQAVAAGRRKVEVIGQGAAADTVPK